jgi:phenylalanyl-tRNA synthetase beta chain
MLDVEVTSNRGDALSHAGLARDIAARTGRALVLPAAQLRTAGAGVETLAKLENREPKACPHFTLRVIRGIKVGPSPAWLVKLLEAVGQRSINNVVDATNFVNFELGQPSHAFDLDKLAGKSLVVRYAREGEALTTLDGKARTLKADELVVADAERAQSLAGVIGGHDAEVTPGTVNLALEVATWDPATIRRAARRLQIRTDASYRFERIVDPRTIHAAADRLAALIQELAGGEIAPGILEAGSGAASAPLTSIRLRPARVRAILGAAVDTPEIARVLGALGIEIGPSGRAGEDLLCTVPASRPDLIREIDLIEEIGRILGLSRVPTHERVSVRVASPQESERAVKSLAATLTGQGYFETVTFAFCTRPQAKLFLPAGREMVEVDDSRRAAEPVCRPSVLIGLLGCRKGNQDSRADAEVAQIGAAGVRLFEVASTFAQQQGSSAESRVLALAIDVAGQGRKRSLEDKQRSIRAMRGTIETLARTMGAGEVSVTPASPTVEAFDEAAYATVSVGGRPLGAFGLTSAKAMQAFDLAAPMVLAELDLAQLTQTFPPRSRVTGLPAFPSSDRDLSLLIDEKVRWADVHGAIASAGLKWLEGVEFVTTYRGPQAGAGKKSVTARLRFRDASRTLTGEDVEGQIAGLVKHLSGSLGAAVRQ